MEKFLRISPRVINLDVAREFACAGFHVPRTS